MEHVTNAIVREAGSSKFYNAVEKKAIHFLMDEPELIGEEQLEPALLDPLTSALGFRHQTDASNVHRHEKAATRYSEY